MEAGPNRVEEEMPTAVKTSLETFWNYSFQEQDDNSGDFFPSTFEMGDMAETSERSRRSVQSNQSDPFAINNGGKLGSASYIILLFPSTIKPHTLRPIFLVRCECNQKGL